MVDFKADVDVQRPHAAVRQSKLTKSWVVAAEQARPIGGTVARVLDQRILGCPAPGHGILCSLSARASLVLALKVTVKHRAIAKGSAVGLKARWHVLLSQEERIGRAVKKIL